MERGKFLVVEGLDGAGTTTQTAFLVAALRRRGLTAHATCEPSKGPVGVLIRQVLSGRLGLGGGKALSPQTMALLFAADREDHLEAEIKPALAQGHWVVSDRYMLSSLAYQHVSLSMNWIATLNEHALVPDGTVFLRIEPELAASRMGMRPQVELYEALETQRKVAENYERAIAIRRQVGEHIICVEGSLPKEQLSRHIEEVFLGYLGL
ncbi:MAG: dTMP kinase [Proteobacteria bacterium]|nr:dTMP kinase [Cystobacterineae bacterium]MCL2258529.1 dTMP kinase [Cystobacterineae bacterium]MCL2315243.1 dTMP kinase [Pseudomonadota bacterium]